MKQRAQAAMEFLMTYGWAILVVLAAIGALAYFGVLSPDQFVNERCTLGSDFQCNNELVDATSATMSLVNTQSEPVTVWSVTLDGGCFESVAGTGLNTSQQTTPRDQTAVLDFACTPGNSNTVSTLEEIDVTVLYQRDSEDINRTATGEFLARVQ